MCFQAILNQEIPLKLWIFSKSKFFTFSARNKKTEIQPVFLSPGAFILPYMKRKTNYGLSVGQMLRWIPFFPSQDMLEAEKDIYLQKSTYGCSHMVPATALQQSKGIMREISEAAGSSRTAQVIQREAKWCQELTVWELTELNTDMWSSFQDTRLW